MGVQYNLLFALSELQLVQKSKKFLNLQRQKNLFFVLPKTMSTVPISSSYYVTKITKRIHDL